MGTYRRYSFCYGSSPFGKHQKISARISQQLLNELDKCKNANVYIELDWIINEETVVRPDVLITCEEVEEHLKISPKVIFEIVSKSTAIKDEEMQ